MLISTNAFVLRFCLGWLRNGIQLAWFRRAEGRRNRHLPSGDRLNSCLLLERRHCNRLGVNNDGLLRFKLLPWNGILSSRNRNHLGASSGGASFVGVRREEGF